MPEPSSASQPATSAGGSGAPEPASSTSTSASPAAAAPPTPQQPNQHSQVDEDDPQNCPICRYIEEGPCADEHVGWRVCKGGARREDPDGDWVDRCSGQVGLLVAPLRLLHLLI
jgi:hypothetical protein